MYATIVRILILVITAPLWLPVLMALREEMQAALAADESKPPRARRPSADKTLSGLVHRPRFSRRGGALGGLGAQGRVLRRLGRRGAF